MSTSGQQNRDPSVAVPRAIVMAVVVVLGFALVVGRLYSIQIAQGDDFLEKSLNNFVQFKRLEHARGEIVDREGRVLATNRPSLNVYVTPAFFPNAKRMVLRLGAAAGLSRAESQEVSAALSAAVRDEGPPLLLARGVSRAAAKRVRAVQRKLDIGLEAVPILPMPSGEASEAGEVAVYLDPRKFPSTTLILRTLEHQLELDEDAMKRLRGRIRRARGLARYRDIVVRRDVGPAAEGRLSLLVQLGELPGVTVRRANAREYPHGQLAAHTLGYVNELSSEELEKRRGQGYRLGDAIGRRGVERTFEEELRGTDGRETVVVDSKGRSQRSRFAGDLLEDVGVFEPPTPGNRVVLSLDMDLQRAAEEAFHGQLAGSVVALEARTGRLLALTSTPSFNPQKLAGYFDPAEKRRLDEMKALRPWRFRAIQDYFAPGSTFKVVTALAALKSGVTTVHEKVRCPGAFRLGRARWRCWKESGHGLIDLPLSLARSCDVWYYTMGARMGLEPIHEMGLALGFGRTTGIPLAPESKGIMPGEQWYARNAREGYTLGAAVNVSIGQGAISATPIQLATAYAAIANGGTVYQPQVALRIETYDGKESRDVPPKVVRKLDLPPENIAAVREGLREVVNEPFGTAYYRRSRLLAVSGKTGTAQVARMGKNRVHSRDLEWKIRDHAWFAAFAPSADPEIVVAVFVEHGGGGSSAAAPIAIATIDAWWTKKQMQAGLPKGPLTIAVLDETLEPPLHVHEAAD